LYSWYKYARILGISKKPVKKDSKKIGLVASCSNEYLHVDLTEFLAAGKKVYIAFVMDNYSRMILGFHVMERRTFEVVKIALKKAIDVIVTHPDHKHSFLVTDGGSENHNREIDDFIFSLSGHKVTKIRALKDITFSNSPVEAVHRTMKGRYLRKKVFETLAELDAYLEWAVEDYNCLRPHYKHAPKTPKEVYFGLRLGFDVKKRKKRAVQDRVKHNLCARCIQCRGGLQGNEVCKKGMC